MWFLFKYPKSRNVLFPFALAQLLVLGGSLSTVLFFASAIYLIFLNPASSLSQVLQKTKSVFHQIPALWTLCLFFILVLISSPVGQNRAEGLIIVGSYLHFLVIVPMAVGLVQLTPNVNFAGIFSRGFRFAIILGFLFGSYQAIWYGLRAEAWASNALVFGTVCLAGSGLAALKWPQDNRQAFIIGLAAYGLGLCTVFLTGSRGVLLTAILLTIAGFFYFAFNSQIRKITLVWSAVLIFAGIAGLIFILSNSFGINRIIERKFVAPLQNMLEGKIPDASVGIRLDMQVSGFTAFKDSPIFGHGLQNVTSAATNVEGRAEGSTDFSSFNHLHNDYLTHAVGGGILMVLVFVFTLLLPYILARGIKDPVNRNAMIGFGLVMTIVYAGMALTNMVFRHDILMTFFSASMVFILAARLQEKKGIQKTEIPDYRKIITGQSQDGVTVG